MSIVKSFSLALALLTASVPALRAENPNLLADASFANVALDANPGTPWKTRAKGENTAILHRVPEGAASQNWIYVKDRDAEEKVYLMTDVVAVAKGTLSFKLRLETESATVGIYLRSQDLPKDDNAVVEFKALEESNNIYVGAHGKRTKLPIDAKPGTMDFEIEFEATDAGEAIALYVKDESGRNLVHRETVPGGGTVHTVMITTDSQTAGSEFYVGDLKVVSRD